MARAVATTVKVSTRWWFSCALYVGVIAIHLGLIGDAPSDEYMDGRIGPGDRLARWLVSHSMTLEVG